MFVSRNLIVELLFKNYSKNQQKCIWCKKLLHRNQIVATNTISQTLTNIYNIQINNNNVNVFVLAVTILMVIAIVAVVTAFCWLGFIYHSMKILDDFFFFNH